MTDTEAKRSDIPLMIPLTSLHLPCGCIVSCHQKLGEIIRRLCKYHEQHHDEIGDNDL